MRAILAGLLALLFMRKQKDPVKTFTCHRCPKQITLKTMELDEDFNPVCHDCYLDNASAEEVACVLHDLK